MKNARGTKKNEARGGVEEEQKEQEREIEREGERDGGEERVERGVEKEKERERETFISEVEFSYFLGMLKYRLGLRIQYKCT